MAVRFPVCIGYASNVRLMKLFAVFMRLARFAPGGAGILLVTSLLTNLLALVSPFYMMHIYDSVIASNSATNLFAVSGMALFLYLLLAGFDLVRSKLLAASVPLMEQSFRRYANALVAGRGLKGERFVSLTQALDRLEQMMASPTMLAVLDLPFSFIFLFAAFLVHPVIGWVGVAGSAVMVLLAVVFARRTGEGLQRHRDANRHQGQFGVAVLGQLEYVHIEASRNFIMSRWLRLRDNAQKLQWSAAHSSLFGLSITKTLRMVLQSMVLGVGAWLVLEQSLSAGAIIAASVLVARGMAPLEQVAGSRRNIEIMEEALQELAQEAGTVPAEAVPYDIEVSRQGIAVRNLRFRYPGSSKPLFNGVNIAVGAASICAITGPVGCGKSTFLRCLLGMLEPEEGHVSIGDSIVTPALADRLAASLAYLPQSSQLFPMTVAENIALSDEPARLQTAVDEAKTLGFHGAINALEQGFDTIPFHERGCILSPGLVQMTVLARTLLREAPLIVLDEPTQSLDAGMVQRVCERLAGLRDKGAAIVIATHDPQLIRASDHLLLFHPVAGLLFGPTKEILSRLAAIEGQAMQNAKAGARLS